jgi:two-component system chemotaxis response regulator CheY
MSADTRIRILVVEDSITAGRIIASLLAQVGFTDVENVLDAQSALELLRKKMFDLVVSDWRLGSMSGLELLRRIRQDPAVRDLRFLLVTASAHPQLPQTLRTLRADGFLIKPFTAEGLKKAIDQAFGSKGE